MHGPILTMPSVFDTNPLFPRSHSSSDIPDLVNVNYVRPLTRQAEELPRSASFSSITALESPEYSTQKQLHHTVSAVTTPISPERHHNAKSEIDGTEGVRVSREERPKLERVGRRKSLVARPKSWIQRVKGSPERHASPEPRNRTSSEIPPVPSISRAPRDKTKTVSESFATFARKSWISSSRSPSPSRNIEKERDEDGEHGDSLKLTASSVSSSSPRRSLLPPPKFEKLDYVKHSDSPPKQPSRAATTLNKIKSRPQSVLMNFTTFNSANSSTSSLPRSSADNRSTPRTSIDKVPPIPAPEKLQVHEGPRRRDELWSAFRSLENDFSKFQAKSWSLKTNVVRASLLPFLRNHVSHPSNKNLRPEDLDRRITILNKWWVGLLDVLDGRQNQTVSGVDRPVLLEATVAIMTRPEWRMAPSAFAPLSKQSPNHSPERPSLRRQKSSNSLNSSASQFLTESVYHNIRNLFIQNLLAQMSFVVDKMSLRHAPASLVTFCGKAAAYAFFFVPGIGEILVRIWKLQSETLRRTADELGLPRNCNKIDLDEVTAAFPPHIQSLGWSSVKSMGARLRQRPDLPIAAAKIPWYGPWVARWCGRDSDLFFVFIKHYHILVEDFVPSGMPFPAKALSPGFVLVQAQVLTALDETIHRQPAAEPPQITFDDVLAGADATAAALPLPSNNSARLMAENRLIMLLRDFISERPSDYEQARMTFAETFGKMMQATARRTSIFDHSACFVLCDFMEEALILFVRFHHAHALESDFIDWYFWLDVCKKMLESQNTMSEIRLFSFLYGTWAVITNNERRKEIMCLDWLLSAENFDKFFNHWCPMVRAYYMRLLCWRLCRDDGEATELDTKIYSAVSTNLKSTWSKYLFVKQAAEKSNQLLPSTVPCHPAPGRRLLIIRSDNHSPAANLLLGFDGIMPPSLTSGATQPTAYKRHSSLSALSKIDTADASNPKLSTDPPTTPTKKRWTFMGKMLPSTFSTQTDGSSSPTSPTKTLEDARRETALARSNSRPPQHSKTPSSDSETPPATSTHRAYSFKFSLEYTQHFEKSSNGSGRGGPGVHVGSERRMVPPRLPAPAHAWLGTRVPGINKEVGAKDPAMGGNGGESVTRAKYAGRALAEWMLIVGECNNFVDRRRSEGVPGLKWVEIPTLSIEGFRRF